VTIGDAQGIGTITNDNSATIAANNVSDLEASGPFAFDVILSQPVDTDVTVDFSTSDGSATVADNDYSAVTNKTITFTAGTTTTQVVQIQVLDDNKLEEDETFTVRLSNLNSAAARLPSTARG